MRAVLAAWFLIGSSLVFVACGGHDDLGPAQDASPSSDGSPIVTGDGATNETSPPPPEDTAPKGCWVASSRDAALDACDSCSHAACADHWTATWGAGWSTDTWGGACAKDATCLCTCDEQDLVCRQNCDILFEDDGCRAAKQALYDCETASCSKQCGRSF